MNKILTSPNTVFGDRAKNPQRGIFPCPGPEYVVDSYPRQVSLSVTNMPRSGSTVQHEAQWKFSRVGGCFTYPSALTAAVLTQTGTSIWAGPSDKIE